MGNAAINDVTDISGVVDYAWSHAIISDQVYHGIKKNCDFSEENQTKACDISVGGLLEAYTDIDIYSIYSPICLNKYQKAVSAKLVVAPRLFTRHVSLSFPTKERNFSYNYLKTFSFLHMHIIPSVFHSLLFMNGFLRT